MLPDERSMEIGTAFTKYVKIGEKSFIENFTQEEIEKALVQLHMDKGSGHYIAMERRIAYLEEEVRKKRTNKEKWMDRIIGFISALIVGFIIYLVTSLTQ